MADRTEEEVTAGLLALIAYAGNAAAAARSLKAQGKLTVTPATLNSWAREQYVDRYEELREKYSAKLEAQIVGDLRELIGQALDVQRLAVEKARAKLKGGEDKDPGHTAANLASVTRTATDKMLALQGRPTQITESRDATQIMRGLAARYPQLFGITEEPPKQIEGAVEPGQPASDRTPG